MLAVSVVSVAGISPERVWPGLKCAIGRDHGAFSRFIFSDTGTNAVAVAASSRAPTPMLTNIPSQFYRSVSKSTIRPTEIPAHIGAIYASDLAVSCLIG